MKQKCKKEKFDEAEESVERKSRGRRRKKCILVQKKEKNSKKKKRLFSCRLVGGGVVVACAYFIRGKYILTNFSTRAFSEREKESVNNNGNANASFVSTNDATKIDAKQHSKIIVEKENI